VGDPAKEMEETMTGLLRRTLALAAIALGGAAIVSPAADAGVTWNDGAQTFVSFQCTQGGYVYTPEIRVSASQDPMRLTTNVPDQFRIREYSYGTGRWSSPTAWMNANQSYSTYPARGQRLVFYVQYRHMLRNGTWVYWEEYGWVSQNGGAYVQGGVCNL
jgi:hypothetical protein